MIPCPCVFHVLQQCVLDADSRKATGSNFNWRNIAVSQVILWLRQ